MTATERMLQKAMGKHPDDGKITEEDAIKMGEPTKKELDEVRAELKRDKEFEKKLDELTK